MLIFKHVVAFSLGILGFLLPGCSTMPESVIKPEDAVQLDTRVDYGDPVLNSRKIFLFGPIDRRAAEVVIQKLHFLDSKGHAPIDLFLETPGGDMKYAWAIQQTMSFIQSPVNTYALSECNSGGAMLLTAGTGKRRAFHDSVIVLHGLKLGSGNDRPPVDFVTDVQNNYTEFWRKRAKLPPDWLPLPFDSHRILTAEDALKYGIVDEIINR